MHLGIVHDAGPDQMKKETRIGMIYPFPHQGNGEENDNPLVEFENGTKGIANRKYLRYDLVALDDDHEKENHSNLGNVCGKIINPNDPSNPNFKIIQDGLVCYYKWAGEEITTKLGVKGSTQ